MKKSSIISFLRGILVLLSLLNLGLLLMSIVMVKPLWIGGTISFFVMIAAFQKGDPSVESKADPVLGEENNNAH